MADLTNEGIEAANQLTLQHRKALAYNALRSGYGDAIAGDPDAAIKAQAYRQRELTNPLEVQQAQANLEGKQLDNTGQEQTNYFNAQSNPLKIQGLQLGNARAQQETQQSAEAFPLEQKKRRADINYVGASTRRAQVETAAESDKLATARREREVQAGRRVLSIVNDVFAKGGTPEQAVAAFDQHAPMLAQLSNVTGDHIAGVRQAIAQGPAAVRRISEALDLSTMRDKGIAPLPADAIDYAATQYRQTGKLPALGTGSGATRAAILRRAAAQAAEQGATAESDRLNQQSIAARGDYIKDLARSGPSSAGGLVRSGSAVLGHIDTLGDLIDGLANGNLRTINSATQAYKAETGRPAPLLFDAQKKIVTSELVRYLTARGGGVTDRQELMKDLSRANSPAQLKGVIDTYREDIRIQLEAQRQQAKAVGAEQQFDSLLTTRSKKLILGGDAPPSDGVWKVVR